MIKKLISMVPIILGVGLILLFGVIRVSGIWDKGKAKIIASATLMEAIDISELSSSEFTYNGIAEVYKDDKKKKVDCYIRYDARVKAGIDMKEVDFKVDDENKTVKVILPEVKINSNSVDESSISFIPEDVKLDLKDILTTCKEDVEREAMESEELLEMAEDNLKGVIEALLYPVLNSQEYSIIW